MYIDRMEAISDIMTYVMTIVDTVAQVHLSSKALAATTKVRSQYTEEQARKEHELRQEVSVNEGIFDELETAVVKGTEDEGREGENGENDS